MLQTKALLKIEKESKCDSCKIIDALPKEPSKKALAFEELDPYRAKYLEDKYEATHRTKKYSPKPSNRSTPPPCKTPTPPKLSFEISLS